MTDQFTEIVQHKGAEYTMSDFMAWAHSRGVEYDLLNVTTLDDLGKKRSVFIAQETATGDRGENGRFTKLHTTETTNV